MPGKVNYAKRGPAWRRGDRQGWKRAARARRYQDALTANDNKPVRLAFPGYSFIPSRISTQLKYCDEATISSGSSVYISDIIYRGNSLYDPDYATGGGQPMGRDQLATLYNSYKVTGCSIKLTVTSNTGTPLRAAIIPSTSAVAFTDFLEACEQPGSKKMALSTYTGGLSSKTIKRKVKTKNILGIQMLDDEEEAVMGANPSNEWYYHVLITTQPYTGTNYVDCVYYIELVYNVEAFGRIQLSRS